MTNQTSRLCKDGSDLSQMLACHHLDMAIELTLKTILTYLNPSFHDKGIKFKPLWNKTDEQYQKVPPHHSLPNKTEIMRLRDSGNSVQHSGIVPSKSDVIHISALCNRFF